MLAVLPSECGFRRLESDSIRHHGSANYCPNFRCCCRMTSILKSLNSKSLS